MIAHTIFNYDILQKKTELESSISALEESLRLAIGDESPDLVRILRNNVLRALLEFEHACETQVGAMQFGYEFAKFISWDKSQSKLNKKQREAVKFILNSIDSNSRLCKGVAEDEFREYMEKRSERVRKENDEYSGVIKHE